MEEAEVLVLILLVFLWVYFGFYPSDKRGPSNAEEPFVKSAVKKHR